MYYSQCILYISYLASGDRDYEALRSELLTFTAGTNRICRNISINNDVFYEVDEEFTVSLGTSDSSVTVGNPSVVLIRDDDGEISCKSVAKGSISLSLPYFKLDGQCLLQFKE